MGAIHVPPALQRNLGRLGWAEATPVQAAAFEPILAGRDVLGLARTGSGKTGAFLLPVGTALLTVHDRRRHPKTRAAGEPRPSGARRASNQRSGRRTGRGATVGPPSAPVRALVLCPTRELAMQVAREAEALLNGTHISIACMHGKVALGPQVARLAEGVDLLVGTPGRVQELLDAGALNLDSLRALVLDEADRMLDLGLGAQVMSILAATPPDRQVLLFTATMPPKVAALAESILRQPVRLEIDPSGSIVEHVQQTAYRVEDRDRVELLLHLLRAGRDVALLPATATAPRERRPRASMSDVEDKAVSEPIEDAAWRDGVLVFCRTRRRAHWVGAALQRHGFVVGYLHGDRSHAQRVKALEGFRSRRLQVLLATDVAARGLHVESVRTVLQYDLPLDPAEYVHRVGRASHGLEGRGGKGHAVAFVGRSDLERWTVIAAMSGAPAVLLSPPAAVDIAPGPGAMAAPRQHRRASRATAPRAGDRPATTQSPESGPRAQASGQTRRQRQGRTRDGRPEAGNTRQRRPKIRSSPLKPSQRPGRGARPPGA